MTFDTVTEIDGVELDAVAEHAAEPVEFAALPEEPTDAGVEAASPSDGPLDSFDDAEESPESGARSVGGDDPFGSCESPGSETPSDSEAYVLGLPDVELTEDESASLSPAAIRCSIAGAVASIALHAWLLITLSGVVLAPPEQYVEVPLETRFFEPSVPEVEPEPLVPYQLANPDDRELDVREVINAVSLGQQRSETPKDESAPQLVRELNPSESTTPAYDIAEGMELDDRLVVKGTTGEALIQLESALDRVTWEVAQNMKERKVLLVWLLDASASLTEQRKAIGKRLKRIYGELDALADVGQIPRLDKPLLSGVVSFGQSHEFLTKEPTDKFDDIYSAFESLKNDETGVENVFSAVGSVVKHWSKYRTTNGRRIMVVVVTDETGDDFGPPMEHAIAMCRKYGAKSYVVGPSAVFGRRKGFIPYVAPENGRTYQLPVDLGPETAMMEVVNLPFWFNGPQLTQISSGFGPYALSRLVSETGGVYFMTNMTTTEALTPTGVFDAASLKPFVPEYRFGTQAEYEADLRKHPIRAATVMAAYLAEQNIPKGTPNLELRVTSQNYRQEATRAQQTAAESQLALDTILQAFPPGIEKELDREPSARWRMSFCLSYGRLLAQKTRCLEYNSALAAMKGNLTPEDVNTKSNHWIFRPDREINYAPSMKRGAQTAEGLLRRILDEAPGTPWAVLASRELQDPFGLRVVERFIPPPPPPPPQPATPAKKTPQLANDQRPAPPPRPQPPAPPPKLPRL